MDPRRHNHGKTSSSPKSRSQAGMTLVELMVYVGLSSIVFIFIFEHFNTLEKIRVIMSARSNATSDLDNLGAHMNSHFATRAIDAGHALNTTCTSSSRAKNRSCLELFNYLDKPSGRVLEKIRYETICVKSAVPAGAKPSANAIQAVVGANCAHTCAANTVPVVEVRRWVKWVSDTDIPASITLFPAIGFRKEAPLGGYLCTSKTGSTVVLSFGASYVGAEGAPKVVPRNMTLVDEADISGVQFMR